MNNLTLGLPHQQLTRLAWLCFAAALVTGGLANFPDAGSLASITAGLSKSFALYFAFVSVFYAFLSGKQA